MKPYTNDWYVADSREDAREEGRVWRAAYFATPRCGPDGHKPVSFPSHGEKCYAWYCAKCGIEKHFMFNETTQEWMESDKPILHPTEPTPAERAFAENEKAPYPKIIDVPVEEYTGPITEREVEGTRTEIRPPPSVVELPEW